jgi:hypothetical protein
MKLPNSDPHMIHCDCCRELVMFREALYDCELQEFVCGDCALDLNTGGWALSDAGYDSCTGKRVKEMPDRQGYEGWNL